MPTPAKILLVDDHKLVRQTLFLILAEQAHWEIYEAENGRVALDRIPEIKPDVVILDIMMPEMDGLEAGYKIRRLAPETRVILMSSHYTQQEAAVITRQFGDGNFLQKAELAKHLVPTISRLLREESQDALKVPRAVSDNA